MYKYNDGLRNGGRTPKLWIVHGGKIHTFKGGHIPGVVAVMATTFEKNGKWSNATYDLQMPDGACPVLLLAPLHGQVWQENSRRAAFERLALACSFEEFCSALERDFPNASKRMAEGDAALDALGN